MSWSDVTTASVFEGYPWSKLGASGSGEPPTIYEIIRATNERMVRFSASATPYWKLPVDGVKIGTAGLTAGTLTTATWDQDCDPATNAYNWAGLQARIEAIADLCVACCDRNGPYEYEGQRTRLYDDYDGAGEVFQEAMRYITGGHCTNWPRCTQMPTDWTDFGDAAYQQGQAQTDDLMGPWLPYVACRLLDYLRWTLGLYNRTWAGPFDDFGYGLVVRYGSQSPAEATYAAEVADTQDAWTNHSDWTVESAYAGQCAWFEMYHYDTTPATYSGGALRYRFRASYQANHVATGQTPTIQVLVMCQAPAAITSPLPTEESVFDANGNAWASLDYYEMYNAAAADNDWHDTGTNYNDINDCPNAANEPAAGKMRYKGFSLRSEFTLLRWEGNLTYCRSDHTV